MERDGVKKTIVVSATDAPPIFFMLHFERPRRALTYQYEKGINVKAWSLHGPSESRLREELAVDTLSLNATMHGNEFARMLAKIAYGLTILARGTECLEENYLMPCILGTKDDVGYWVGNSEKEFHDLPRDQQLHSVFLVQSGNTVGALIRLFAKYSTPEYEVFVGKLKPQRQNGP